MRLAGGMFASLLLVATTATCQTEADTNADQGDPPEIVHVCTVAPDILSITIRAQQSEHGEQVAYEPQAEDRIEDPDQHRWVIREGQCIGSMVGADGDLIYTLDRVVGRPLDVDWASRPATYRITSDGDPNYTGGRSPEAVFRKSKPTDLARVAPWEFESPAEHRLYLRLPDELVDGAEYTIGFDEGRFEPQSVTFDPSSTRSEAVHVSHLGFRPDDPAKVAFLSCWIGDGGALDYSEGLPFGVLRDDTGESVFTGATTLAKAADDETEDAYGNNHNGTDVYEMDFAGLAEPGTYRVYVEGIGCSYPFVIGGDTWRDAFTVSARGFYHMRSGVELGPPFTDYRRPRCFHPGDGVEVYASTAALMDTGNGLIDEGSNFGNLVAGKTDEIVPDAWGAYMDAGDWDRRIQHLLASRLLLELCELFPAYFAELPLNIPESDDGLPDVASEALFNLDGYRRMQTPEGGIRGGIESSEHPRHGEASWQESLTVMAYAPGVWSSYVYAGVAARAAYVLRELDPERAEVYEESALRAMRWAEDELPRREGKDDPHQVRDARNLAAVELYRLTGDEEWHELFLETTMFDDAQAMLALWQSHEQKDAAFVYVRTEEPAVDAQIRSNCLNAIAREADARATRTGQTGFRWTEDPWRPIAWGALSSPDAVTLARAHHLTGDAKYLRAAVLVCQTGAGANPLNLCYTTGLGHQSPVNPLHIDSRVTHQPAPPGITVLGPLDPRGQTQEWAQEWVDQTLYPPSAEWPTIECYWDVFWYPMICEYTIHQPMAANAYAWGYLAARQ